MGNYNLTQAIDMYNQDQVRTQTMYAITFDSGFESINKILDKMQVYGQSFSLPERTVTFEDVQYRAYKIPVPTTIEMGQEHSVTVYADVRGDLRRAMLDWQAACINPDITGGSFFQSNRRPTKVGSSGSVPTIKIDLLAPDYQTVIESTMIYGARVTKVGGLELSNTSGGISTFSVDFKSVYWEQILGNASNGKSNADSNRSTQLGQPAGEDPNEATTDPMGAPNLA